jgi:hypothetical protein
MPKIDPRNAPGNVAQAATNKVPDKHTARAHLGYTNYCLTFLQCVVVYSSDGKEGAHTHTVEAPTSPFSIRKDLRLS